MSKIYGLMTKPAAQGSFFDWRWCIVDVALLASVAVLLID